MKPDHRTSFQANRIVVRKRLLVTKSTVCLIGLIDPNNPPDNNPADNNPADNNPADNNSPLRVVMTLYLWYLWAKRIYENSSYDKENGLRISFRDKEDDLPKNTDRDDNLVEEISSLPKEESTNNIVEFGHIISLKDNKFLFYSLLVGMGIFILYNLYLSSRFKKVIDDRMNKLLESFPFIRSFVELSMKLFSLVKYFLVVKSFMACKSYLSQQQLLTNNDEITVAIVKQGVLNLMAIIDYFIQFIAYWLLT